MNVSELIGKEVLDKNANKIGKVVDVDLDISRGIIDYIIVKAGLSKKLYVSIASLEKAGDKIILNTTRQDLEKKPTPAR